MKGYNYIVRLLLKKIVYLSFYSFYIFPYIFYKSSIFLYNIQQNIKYKSCSRKEKLIK